MATHSSVLAWRIPWTGVPGKAAVLGVTKSPDMTEQRMLSLFHFRFLPATLTPCTQRKIGMTG